MCGFADADVKSDRWFYRWLASLYRARMVGEAIGDLAQITVGTSLGGEPRDVDLDQHARLE